ncbi:DUF3592 domain-containing protein [Nocardioides sp. NPDC057772]|uniref:DUF3592 domain-containing protein n=1 Tax=Nocardioides sp. NPDC057772 TaxID=3346245 RepID=UPI00366B6E7B
MTDLFGALGLALIGALICASGYLNFRDAKKGARGGRRWSRTTAHVTKTWKQDVSGAAGDMMHHVNYTFTAPETGGSYYGHSEHSPRGVATGDDIEVMYDPKAPYNNELPAARSAMWFFPIAFGVLTIVGVLMTLAGLVGAVVILVDLIR